MRYCLRRTFAALFACSWVLSACTPAHARVVARFRGINGPIVNMQYFDGHVWIASYGSRLFRIDGNNFALIEGDREDHTIDMARIGDELFLIIEYGPGANTPYGLQVVEGAETKEATLEGVSVASLLQTSFIYGGAVWDARTGKARPIGATARSFPIDVQEGGLLDRSSGHALLYTKAAVYRFMETGLGRLQAYPLPYKTTATVGNDLLKWPQGKSYRLIGSSFGRNFNADLDVRFAFEQDHEFQIDTNGGSYRLANGEAHVVMGNDFWAGYVRHQWDTSSDPDLPTSALFAHLPNSPTSYIGVWDSRECGGALWLSTWAGVFRTRGSQATAVASALFLPAFECFGDQLWLTSTAGQNRLYGLYLVEHDKAGPVFEKRLFLGGSSADSPVKELGGKVWVAAEDGVYRVDDDVSMVIDLASANSWWKTAFNHVFGGQYLLNPVDVKVSYIDGAGHQPYPKSWEPFLFQVVMGSDTQALEKARYVPAEDFQRDLPLGRQSLSIRVKDDWGNTQDFVLPNVVVLPSTWILPVLLLGLDWTLALLTLLLAPYSTFCHDLVMNPWVRNLGSFGIIPVILTTVSLARRHVLKRYRRSLLNDAELRLAFDRFVVPEESLKPEKFVEKLGTNRPAIVLGPSGIGKSTFLRFLTVTVASAKRKDALLGGAIPLFVPLSRYYGQGAEEMFQGQLASYGRMTDRALNEWFLSHENFLILFDGLNEIDAETRRRINGFIDRYRKTSHFCVTSQEMYEEFQWQERVRLEPLKPETVREIIKRRFGEKKAEEILIQFAEQTYKILEVPQDLEFAIELVSGGHSIPSSRQELYREILAPVLADWVASDRQDYANILYARAYEMLLARDPFFDQEDQPAPSELKAPLVGKKILTLREKRYQFRHDLIRAYLASLNFAPRWQELLRDGSTRIDSNWLPMLEFSLLGLQDPQQKQALMFALLERDTHVAGKLFKWFSHQCPEEVADWKEHFLRKYGGRDLGVV